MFDTPVPSRFEHVEMAHQVGLRISVRVFDRITNARLGAEMDDPVELPTVQSSGQSA